MPTKNPRVNMVLERALFEALRRMAERDGVSLSLKARDLIREAIESSEDVALGWVAHERERSFKRGKALRHDQVWRKRRSRR
ncbi:MAG: antitoxin, RHH family protein [Candidatus Rokubacteria bacterium]|nr:antitoxin, RHH family protein [Candidatus Rokubacteria bacterium]